MWMPPSVTKFIKHARCARSVPQEYRNVKKKNEVIFYKQLLIKKWSHQSTEEKLKAEERKDDS